MTASSDLGPDPPWLTLPDPARRLSVAAVRERCAALPAPGRVWIMEETDEPRPGALLAPVMEVDGEAALVLTKRALHLASNSGDWVFPGGGFDPGLDADTAATARRETSEELGAALERIEVLGQLSTYVIHASYVLDVYIGLIAPGELRPDPREVEGVEIIPISVLSSPDNYRRSRQAPRVWHRNPIHPGVRRELDPVFHLFAVRPGEEMWGLQGMILHELLERLLG